MCVCDCTCVQVVGGNRQKDVKKKSLRGRKSMVSRDDKRGEGQFDKPLHWVNMQILDHRYNNSLLV